MTQATTPSSTSLPHSRRNLLRTLAAGAVTTAAVANSPAYAGDTGATSGENNSVPAGIRAFKLYIGPDNASHVLQGTINQADRTDVVAIHFKETPPHSSYGWHQDPEPQYVISLSGTLEYATPDGETFILRPGDVLLAEDNAGTGHKWRMIDDQPWRRAYVVLKPGAKDSFVPKAG